jgi:protein-tyrosine phosphatase
VSGDKTDAQYKNLIDLHSHILWGIDDGPKELEYSLKMARIYEQAGFSTVVATPHWVDGASWPCSPELIVQRVDELNLAVRARNMAITILPGMEIGLDSNLPGHLENGKLQPLGSSNYVLIETPFLRLPHGWQEIFVKISSSGYKIMLAHPERCHQLAENLHVMDELVHSGVYLQVNFESFLGYAGRKAAQTARRLATDGNIHCLATDSHDHRHRHAGHVNRAAIEIEHLVGQENLRLIAIENPARVLRGLRMLPMNSFYSGHSACGLGVRIVGQRWEA